MMDKKPIIYSDRLNAFKKEFDYLFQIIKGDYYLYNDPEGISVILKIIFLRLMSVNFIMYKGIWDDIVKEIHNTSTQSESVIILESILDNIQTYPIESNYYKFNSSVNSIRSRFDVKPQTLYTIIEIIRFLDDIPLNSEWYSPRFLADLFYGIIFKLSPMKNRNNNADYFTDDSVSKIIAGIVNLEQGDTIFDPFIGTGGLLYRIIYDMNFSNMSYSNINIIGQDINIELLDICNMLFQLLDAGRLELHLGDSLYESNSIMEINLHRIDKIITHIPYNLKLNKRNYYNDDYDIGYSTNMNYLIIMKIIHMLKYSQQAYIVVPNNVLYSGGKDKEFRKRIINEDLIEAIIEFSDYSIYKGSIKPVILVLNRKKEYYKKNKIHLLNVQDNDLEEVIRNYKKYIETDTSRIISRESISSRNYNLNFSHYDPIYNEVQLLLAQKIGVTLRSIVDIVKPQISRIISYESCNTPYIKQSNLNRDSEDVFMNFKNIDEYEYIENYELNKIIDKKAIIVALQGKDLKPTIFDPQKSRVKSIVLSTNCLALIPKDYISDPINIEYLYYQLYNPRVIRQIDGYKRGLKVKRITYNDLLDVVITKPEYEKQLQFIKDQEEPLRELEKYKKLYRELLIKSDVEKVKAENRVVNMLIHNVSKHISTIGHDIEIVSKVLEEHNLTDFIYHKEEIERHNSSPEVKNGLTKPREFTPISEYIGRTRDRLDLIERTFKDTQKTINLNLELNDFEKINVKELIKEIKRDRELSQSVSYDFIIEGEEAVLDINIQSFKEMIHILINNAEEHAFPKLENSGTNDYFIKFNIKKTKDIVIIEYSNNGSKFNMEKNDFILAGRKRKYSSGSGLGGAYLNRVILSHNGNFEVINSDPGTKFIFNFQIKR